MADGPKTPQENAQEVFDLVKGYAIQETAEPLKGLGDYLKWGLLGSVCLAIGFFFLILALLRGLQQIEFFSGGDDGFGWQIAIPYVIVVAVVGVVVAFLGSRITKGLDA